MTSKFSNFDSSILILLAMLYRMVFASFSRSSEFGNSVVLVLVEGLRIFAVGLKSFRALIGPA